MSKMKKCVFCEIVNGTSPCYEVYKDDYVTAFLDINPVSIGHTLIVTNKHIERLDNIKDNQIANALMNSLIIVSKKLIKSSICKDFTVLQDNGYWAQQDIKHIHFHIIPRHKDEKIVLKLETDFVAAENKNLLKTWEKIKLHERL
ncbi:HIT family protein [Anoxybacteroides rupiense]|uniref:HIT family protein n=1 Tax=Anoxybacteroides rupiense TaxID=311460 RepID=UPI003FA586EB